MEVKVGSLSRSFIHNGLISLMTAILIAANPVALAQDQSKPPTAATDGNEQHFIIESALAISKMSLATSVDPTGDVDRDFVAMMLPHHQGGIEIARAEVKYGHNDELRRLAQNIISQREQEMALLRDRCWSRAAPAN
jgi:uncharacterized protein (DUF305 family)